MTKNKLTKITAEPGKQVRTNTLGTRKDIFMGCNTGGVYG